MHVLKRRLLSASAIDRPASDRSPSPPPYCPVQSHLGLLFLRVHRNNPSPVHQVVQLFRTCLVLPSFFCCCSFHPVVAFVFGPAFGRAPNGPVGRVVSPGIAGADRRRRRRLRRTLIDLQTALRSVMDPPQGVWLYQRCVVFFLPSFTGFLWVIVTGAPLYSGSSCQVLRLSFAFYCFQPC